jgi:hypothetical protein
MKRLQAENNRRSTQTNRHDHTSNKPRTMPEQQHGSSGDHMTRYCKAPAGSCNARYYNRTMHIQHAHRRGDRLHTDQRFQLSTPNMPFSLTLSLTAAHCMRTLQRLALCRAPLLAVARHVLLEHTDSDKALNVQLAQPLIQPPFHVCGGTLHVMPTTPATHLCVVSPAPTKTTMRHRSRVTE